MRVVLLLAVALSAGCADGHSTARGRAVFDRSCSGCHTLSGHDTSAPGGDLRVAHLTASDVASFARVMPVRPPLTPTEARAVGRYVASR